MRGGYIFDSLSVNCYHGRFLGQPPERGDLNTICYVCKNVVDYAGKSVINFELFYFETECPRYFTVMFVSTTLNRGKLMVSTDNSFSQKLTIWLDYLRAREIFYRVCSGLNTYLRYQFKNTFSQDILRWV